LILGEQILAMFMFPHLVYVSLNQNIILNFFR
jgi:hypothetical protein